MKHLLLIAALLASQVWYAPENKDDPFGDKAALRIEIRDRENGTYRGMSWPFEGISVPLIPERLEKAKQRLAEKECGDKEQTVAEQKAAEQPNKPRTEVEEAIAFGPYSGSTLAYLIRVDSKEYIITKQGQIIEHTH